MKKKNVSFRFNDNVLVIRVPLFMQDKEVITLIKKNEDRIHKLLIKVQSTSKKPLSFEIGQKIKVLEKEYLIVSLVKRYFSLT